MKLGERHQGTDPNQCATFQREEVVYLSDLNEMLSQQSKNVIHVVGTQ